MSSEATAHRQAHLARYPWNWKAISRASAQAADRRRIAEVVHDARMCGLASV
jgi:hypothetical protein